MVKCLIMYSNEPPSDGHVERLRGLSPDLSVVVADSEETAITNAADTDIILGHRYLRQTLSHTRRLKWIQSTAAGPQHLLSPELRAINPVLTRCTAFSDAVAWHAFTLALTMIRAIPDALAAQQRGVWTDLSDRPLNFPKTAMIFGMGRIGQKLADILRRNGLTVLGVNQESSHAARAACDELFSDDLWRDHLHRADVCFITLPLTPQTQGLFDKSVLEALPPHAVLVNVGRGPIVDTDALIETLNAGHLGGAALDVLDPKPPSTHPLWTTPRLLITPKVSVFSPDRQQRLEGFIEEQVARYLNGEPLLDRLDLNTHKEGTGK